jgi:hypothetical protein
MFGALGADCTPPNGGGATQIRTWTDLNALRNDVSSSYLLMNDLDSTTAGYAALASATANGGAGWQPIDNFGGNFDGQGHVIRDLNIQLPNDVHVGLFGSVMGGNITNIGVVNANVIGNQDVGGLVGWNNGGTVSNSYATGSIGGFNVVGGLVGDNAGTVSNSYSTGSVAGGNDSVGGLVGYNGGTVGYSYSVGRVSGTTNVGGLVGQNTGTVSNSFWDTQTSGQATSAGGTGKTTTEMKSIETYQVAGWSITYVADADKRNTGATWNIVLGQTYPFLSWIPSEGQMEMDAAINMVVNDILPNIPEVQAGNPYWCLKLDSSLPQGTVIQEASDSASNVTLDITLDQDMFFFYLDLAPGAYYAHPVKYIFVYKTGGDHWEYAAKWWPLINGKLPEELRPAVPDKSHVIAANVGVEELEQKAMEFHFPVLLLSGCEGFIVVQGLMSTEYLYNAAGDTYNNMYNFFSEYTIKHVSPCSQVVGLVQSNATDVFTTIDDMVADGLNPITIYIIAHGDAGNVKLGGKWTTVTQFYNKFTAHPGTIFNLILNSCYSGSFIDDLSALPNVYDVVAACRADESAYEDYDSIDLVGGGKMIDYNPTDSGAEWTSSLLEAMSQIVGDNAKFNSVSTFANDYDVPTTCALIWLASDAARADCIFPELNQPQNLDLCNRVWWETPQNYCNWFVIF